MPVNPPFFTNKLFSLQGLFLNRLRCNLNFGINFTDRGIFKPGSRGSKRSVIRLSKEKLEKKRQKDRELQRNFWRRNKERIASLEAKVKELEEQNRELNEQLKSLELEVQSLRNQT
ncbi:hypothetical protein F5884DRAFT_899741 [Xylogone sp. PMI_703]|nr:hypothetical protein F5884DRAFT_899741 [Xylogone sp. PMI_703]